jgi:hypothetical protein
MAILSINITKSNNILSENLLFIYITKEEKEEMKLKIEIRSIKFSHIE